MAQGATTKQSNNAIVWTSTQAYVLAIICLLIGGAVGYFLRGSAGTQPQQVAGPSGVPAPSPMGMGQPQVTPEQLKHMADVQAAPLLEKLKSAPNDAALVGEIGNVYYDVRQYEIATGYYERSLKIKPDNPNVRTDLGTSYFYLGNPDRALREFDTALKYDPKHTQTIFNIGMVRWQGKMDPNGALAAWEKLLQIDPNYPERQRVEMLIVQVRQHMNIKPGTKTDKPPNIQLDIPKAGRKPAS